ncbi:leucyl aminopeptidase [Murinocardiopsis flavida]|uniref:Probable cytosol aminopeptidase n=1 Tax=Murinocardiopsis flavida TaxID=645275 RepID=A0A2P8DJH6_9ACTN|nr:leucyl aminopeptidase [Murinocardiopsis flavida]PSK97351.1 leucyl aminopeptidase [Murinocardiopsis flavida]
MPLATEIHPVQGGFADTSADLVALPVVSGADGPVALTAGAAADLDARLPAPLAELVVHYELTGAPGESAQLPVDLGRGLVRFALLGIGDGGAKALRKAGAAFARLAKGRERAAISADSLGHANGAASLTAFTEGALLAGYSYTLAAVPKKPAPVPAIDLLTGGADPGLGEHVRRGTALARATSLARDLINTPSAEKDPAWLAARADEAAAKAGLAVSTWDEDALAADGFGAILAVGSGSDRPPRLVQVEYRPEAAERHVVLVGKGITFDTGGLSLKPNDNMVLMKTDMSGAAVVIGVMSALAELGCPVRVTALLAIAENAFSGSAQRPGDVLTTYGGRTVEVLNTDAEGRLVMADALAYAVDRLAPDTLVDVATLTGAAKLALGTGLGALFATDDTLAAALTEAGEESGEALWRMPLTEQYGETLRSRVADLANIGTSTEFGRPGACEAALFLREFTGGLPWAHLDIAGPGRAMSDDAELTKGGTGFSTRLLLRWLAA